MDLGERIQKLRKQKKLTQTELAKQIDISLPQLVRYETKNVQPTASTLNKLAMIFDVSIDFLVNGNIDEKAANNIEDSTLLKKFRAINDMSIEDKDVIITLIDAFITKKKVQQLAS